MLSRTRSRDYEISRCRAVTQVVYLRIEEVGPVSSANLIEFLSFSNPLIRRALDELQDKNLIVMDAHGRVEVTS